MDLISMYYIMIGCAYFASLVYQFIQEDYLSTIDSVFRLPFVLLFSILIFLRSVLTWGFKSSVAFFCRFGLKAVDHTYEPVPEIMEQDHLKELQFMSWGDPFRPGLYGFFSCLFSLIFWLWLAS